MIADEKEKLISDTKTRKYWRQYSQLEKNDEEKKDYYQSRLQD